MKKRKLALMPVLIGLILVMATGLVACNKKERPDVKPNAVTEDSFSSLASAFDNSLSTDGELSLPVSIGFDAFGATAPLNGELHLSVDNNKRESGDIANAFKLRFDIDLTTFQLISGIADTLTVRYPGDGLLLVMLNRRTEGKDSYLATYAVDLGAALQLLGNVVNDDEINDIIKNYISIEKNDDGFTASATPAAVTAINYAYKGLLSQLETTLSDERGVLRSLFEANFTGISANLTGTDKISDIDVIIEGEPPVNVTNGEKFDVNFDVGLLSSSGMLTSAFEGELQLRLSPAAIWSKDYFTIAEAGLHLDLSPAGTILQMVSMFAPAGSLPEFVGPDLNGMDVYYTGDGVLTLALNNTTGNPVFVTQVDLKTVQLPALPENAASSLLAEFRFERKANGFVFALGDPIVQAVNEAYQGLVKMAKDYITASAGTLGEIAGSLIENMIGATIDDIEFFIGTDDEDNLMFDFAVKGVPVFDAEDDYSQRRLLSLTLTHGGELNEQEKETLLANSKTVAELVANAKTAAEFEARIQDLIDNIDLTADKKDAYAQKVNELKAEITDLPENVKSLISNKSYLADANYNGDTLSKLLVMQALYSERANAFENLLPSDDNYDGFGQWDAINTLYDNADATHQYDLGITVPAIKDSPAMKKAIGENRVEAFVAARNEHEAAVAQSLKERITQSTAQYKDATARDQLLALLQDYLEVRSIYESLHEENRAELDKAYNDYMALAYTKNFDGLKQAYESIKEKMQTLTQKHDATVDELLKIMKELVPAYEWKSGMDLWQKGAGDIKPWLNWLSNVPSQYNERSQEISGLDSDVHLNGDITNELVEALKDKIVTALKALDAERKQYMKDGSYDFTGLSNGETLLEKLHEWRYFINRVLPTAVKIEFREDQDLKEIMGGIAKYETALSEYLSASND